MADLLLKPLLLENIEFNSKFYLFNISTRECVCWEYIWNSSLWDKCRHYYAATLFKDAIEKEFINVMDKIKYELVQYFRNKERVVPLSAKNNIIYQDTIENSFQEIVWLYWIHGNVLY